MTALSILLCLPLFVAVVRAMVADSMRSAYDGGDVRTRFDAALRREAARLNLWDGGR